MLYKNPHIEQCLEGNHSLLKGLNQKEKETLIQHHTYAQYKKGEFLLKDGEMPHGLICLSSGKVKVFKKRTILLIYSFSNCSLFHLTLL